MLRSKRHAAPLGGGNAGFTLIELLVVMGISTVLMVAMVGMFRSNRTAFTLLDQLRSLEENSRVAADFIARDLRPAKNSSLLPIDNTAADYADVATNLGAVDGTDIIRIFASDLAKDPIVIPNGGRQKNPQCKVDFNTQGAQANIDVFATDLDGFPGFDPGMSGQALNDLLSQYTVLIYDCDNPTTNCTKNITAGGWNAGGCLSQIGYNNGMDADDANRPHECTNVQNAYAGGADLCISIGAEVYYYVRPNDPGDTSGVAPPQLVRYEVGAGTHETVANYVEDMQIDFGLDTDADGVVDSWVDGAAVGALTQITMVAANFMMVTTYDDEEKAAVPPTALSNSTIASAGVADQKRRRVIQRTTRLRNAN